MKEKFNNVIKYLYQKRKDDYKNKGKIMKEKFNDVVKYLYQKREDDYKNIERAEEIIEVIYNFYNYKTAIDAIEVCENDEELEDLYEKLQYGDVFWTSKNVEEDFNFWFDRAYEFIDSQLEDDDGDINIFYLKNTDYLIELLEEEGYITATDRDSGNFADYIINKGKFKGEKLLTWRYYKKGRIIKIALLEGWINIDEFIKEYFDFYYFVDKFLSSFEYLAGKYGYFIFL